MSRPPNAGSPAPFLPDWSRASGSRGASETVVGPSHFLPDWIDAPQAPQPDGRRPIVIRGGDCVLPGHGIVRTDVRLEGGLIAAIGPGLSDGGCETIAAEGKLVCPGVIDPHTHLGLFAPFEVEAFTETRSAVLNGVTTMGMFVGGQSSYLPILDAALPQIRDRAVTDLFVHLAIFTKEQLDEIPIYASKYGVRSFKGYMTGIPGLIPSLDEGFLLDLMAAVAAVGPDAVLCVHAENWRIVDWATARVQAERPEAISLKEWGDTHPGFSEAEAIQRAVLLAEQSGVSVYIVHLSSVEGLETVRRLRREGGRFYVETTSPYLTLSYETPMGALAKMVPPIRSRHDQEALWGGLSEDLIDTIGTDHTPMTRAQKQPDPGIWKTMPGYPAVGTHLPSLLDGARRRGYSVVDLVEKISANPARIFGLYPRKGAILPGSDADLLVLDLDREQTVSAERAFSRADFALHEGERLVGWPDVVIKSGRMISADEMSGGAGVALGRYLRRQPSGESGAGRRSAGRAR
jgi:dihydropyrimidinase